MAEQNIHIHFSLTDIERYLQGRMSTREMHDLEKAALQDPFLADAIEGYGNSSLPVARQHLNEIAAALQAEKEEEGAKVVPLTAAPRKWWKVAAAVILLAGAGTAGWFVFNKPAPSALPELAQHKQVTPPAPPAAPQVTDSFKPAEPEQQKKALPEKINKTLAFPKAKATPPAELAAAPKPSQPEPATIASATPAISNNETAAAFAAPNASAMRLHAEKTDSAVAMADNKAPATGITGYGALRKTALSTRIATNGYVLQGMVLDSRQQPISNACVKPENGKSMAMTDDQGKFTLRSMDSAVTVHISSLGHEDLQAPIKSNGSNVLRMQDASESLADMVVTEIRSRKKAENSRQKNAEAYPEGGWQSFQEYVYNKLNKQIDSTGGNAKLTGGDIELEFLVNENGLPYDFKVVRSFDKSLNNGAIEAVKNGPRWISTGKNKKSKVTLHF